MRKLFYLFIAVSMAATACGGKKESEVLTIASEQADCMGVAPQKCMLIKREGNTDWEFWYTGIEGFEYEPGYEYVVKIRREKVSDPPADMSSVRYVLEKVVSKVRKESEGLPTRIINYPME